MLTQICRHMTSLGHNEFNDSVLTPSMAFQWFLEYIYKTVFTAFSVALYMSVVVYSDCEIWYQCWWCCPPSERLKLCTCGCQLVYICVRFCDTKSPHSLVMHLTIVDSSHHYTPRFNEVERGGIPVSRRPSVRLSICLWTKPCPLCISHNTSRIHFLFVHLIKQLP